MSRLYKFYFDDTEDFLQELAKDEVPLLMEPEKHSFVLEEKDKVVLRMRLPLFYPAGEEREPLWHYLERVEITKDHKYS